MNQRSSASYRLRYTLAAAFAALALSGCGRPFDVETPHGFVELDGQGPAYDYRATTPDGVVVGVRAIEAKGRGDVAFWEQAVTLQLHDVSGYALLGAKDVSSADGSAGRRLKFGHDEDGKPYLYTVAVFVAQDRVFLLEAGGSRAAVERFEPKLAWQVETFHARCGFPVAPVLASRTCNRW